jgi:hypothetical protein
MPVLLVGLTTLGVGLLFYFDAIPPYTPPAWLGITRPSLVSSLSCASSSAFSTGASATPSASDESSRCFRSLPS